MKKDTRFSLSIKQLSPLLFREFKSTLVLLEPRARRRYLLLSALQVVLAFLEVAALSVLAITITFGLNSYTNISGQQNTSSDLLWGLFSNVSTEAKIASLLGAYVVLTIAKTMLSAIITLATLSLLANQSAKIGFQLNRATYDQESSLIRFGKSQENLSGVTYSLDSLLIGYLGTYSQLLGDIVSVLMVCIALLLFDLETALLLFSLFTILLGTLHRFVNIKAAKWGEKLTKSSALLNRRVLDSWLVYRETLLAQKVDDLLRSSLFLRLENAKNRARLIFLPSLSKYIFELFLISSALVISVFQLWFNGISEAVSSLVLIVAASTRLLPSLLRLQGNLLSIKQSVGSGVYARETLRKVQYNLTEPVSSDVGDFPNKEFNPTIFVKDLSYSYPESSKPAVRNISLSITPGTFTAVTGSSGSGKSTLVDLILGFLKPSSGSVLISNLDPVAAQKSWPGKIAYVPQDIQIIEGSIEENITLSFGGETNKTRLQNSIDASGLFEDIANLDQGVDTQIGERGLKLSGGQKQRLGIARALYCNPDVLVFDEATSSLDPITENRIAKSIYKKLSSRTVLVVAHRLSTVMNADKVIYLRDGCLVASGTFDELKRSVPEFLKQAELSGL